MLFSASMLAILEACEAIAQGQVIGVDIDIRPHNKAAILAHPLSKKITLIEGSSIDAQIIQSRVHAIAKKYSRIMVCLDSNHTHEHVLAELEAYAPLVSMGSYCMVGDTVIEDAPAEMVSQRPWGKGNSPKTAIWAYLKRLNDKEHYAVDGSKLNFEIDKMLEAKIALTGSPDGYLRRL